MQTVVEQSKSKNRCDHVDCNRVAHLLVHESGHGGKPYWLCKQHWEGMMRDCKQIRLKREQKQHKLPEDTEVELSCDSQEDVSDFRDKHYWDERLT